MTTESTGWCLQLQPLRTLMFCQYRQVFSCSNLKIVGCYWWFINSVCHTNLPPWTKITYDSIPSPLSQKTHKDRLLWRIEAWEYSQQTPVDGFNMGCLRLQAFHQAQTLLNSGGNDQSWRSHCPPVKTLNQIYSHFWRWGVVQPFLLKTWQRLFHHRWPVLFVGERATRYQSASSVSHGDKRPSCRELQQLPL